jgi:hypothetical protein
MKIGSSSYILESIERKKIKNCISSYNQKMKNTSGKILIKLKIPKFFTAEIAKFLWSTGILDT